MSAYVVVANNTHRGSYELKSTFSKGGHIMAGNMILYRD